jgi:hypothetical protein
MINRLKREMYSARRSGKLSFAAGREAPGAIFGAGQQSRIDHGGPERLPMVA